MLKQHVLVELRQFIQSVSSYRGGNLKSLTSSSLVRTSLHLLEDLPAAREIVFEYFALVCEVGVQSYVNTTNVDPQTGVVIQPQKSVTGQQLQQHISVPVEDTCFDNIQQVLENMVSKGPAVWGAVVASWCLDLVGSLSDKYSKQMSIGSACNYWLSCNTMRGLLTLISICFRKLTNAEAEKCVETLLCKLENGKILSILLKFVSLKVLTSDIQ